MLERFAHEVEILVIYRLGLCPELEGRIGCPQGVCSELESAQI